MIMMLGLAAMLLVVYGLVRGLAAPIAVLLLIPIGAALLAGFSLHQIGEFAEQGMKSVFPIATLFLFAVLFFSVVRDAGMFDPLVKLVLRLSGDNIPRVTVATSVVAIAVMLEGIGPATFLITISTFLPIYDRLGLSRYDLLFITGLSAGVVNFAPWGGPMGRASLALHLSPVSVWMGLIPLMVIGVVTALGVAAWVGQRAKMQLAASERCGAPTAPAIAGSPITQAAVALDARRHHPSIYWINVGLTIAAVACMFLTKLPPTLIFLTALCLALIVNFKAPAQQAAQIKAHAGDAVAVSALMLSAGCFIGIMTGSGMFPAVSAMLIELVPEALGRYIHVIIGAFSIFLGILFSPDAFYLGLMPMVNGVAGAHGIPPESVTHAMMLGECVGFSATPAVPSAFLAAGLAGCDLGKFMRLAVLRLWLVSLVMLAAGVLFGIISV
ncbi:hypothetical protein AC629_40650 [Bradyrhizobium sp. NAS80.1]|uniref:CitMHS family transporter n=1 Tax=Bradyrhizobium sp. NAS80.1 TaxID=1680159 RepID=UPI00095D0622|nr:citrate:proton symporter [Bradyrhizobium sp. NAS80.1]OKO70236.1 hypothetical protein AC629_40650 [Bradyrhizobium sp. NAS80.1]